MILILNFLKEHDSNLDKISEIFVNQGPGKISSIRNSIAIAKGIAFAKNIDLYGKNLFVMWHGVVLAQYLEKLSERL